MFSGGRDRISATAYLSIAEFPDGRIFICINHRGRAYKLWRGTPLHKDNWVCKYFRAKRASAAREQERREWLRRLGEVSDVETEEYADDSP